MRRNRSRRAEAVHRSDPAVVDDDHLHVRQRLCVQRGQTGQQARVGGQRRDDNGDSSGMQNTILSDAAWLVSR